MVVPVDTHWYHRCVLFWRTDWRLLGIWQEAGTRSEPLTVEVGRVASHGWFGEGCGVSAPGTKTWCVRVRRIADQPAGEAGTEDGERY